MTDPTQDAPVITLRLGPQPENVADLWPPVGPAPSPVLVVLVHGGFWRPAYDRVHLRPMAAALAERGYAVAAIEYRRLGRAAGGWQATCDDVRLALTALPRAAGEALGVQALTAPARLVLIGHSAGGQLVLWAGSQIRDGSLAGVVSLAGVCDLRLGHALRLGDGGGSGAARGAVETFLGGGPEEAPGAYAATDPMSLPLPAAPVVLLHGTDDEIVPIELSRRYALRPEAVAEPGRVTHVALPGVEHFGPIEPGSAAWGAVTDALDGLARR